MIIEENKIYAIMGGSREPLGMMEIELEKENIHFVRNKNHVHAWHCNSLPFGHMDIEGYVLNGNFYKNDIKTLKKHYNDCKKEVTTKEPKTIIICKSEQAVFCGTSELQGLMNGNIEYEYSQAKTQGYIEHSLEDLKELAEKIKNEQLKNKELDLLIEELEDYNFERLVIEY